MDARRDQFTGGPPANDRPLKATTAQATVSVRRTLGQGPVPPESGTSDALTEAWNTMASNTLPRVLLKTQVTRMVTATILSR